MGQVLSRIHANFDLDTVKTVIRTAYTISGRKRKAIENGRCDEDAAERDKKVLKLDTENYMYKRLFLDGAQSDVVICALGRTWNLHRIYLEQCHFFDNLFRGQWNDVNNAMVEIDIVDPNITVEGLNMVFESLYHETAISLDDVYSVIASAAMLSLPSVLNRCAELCCNSITDERVMQYYLIADQYRLPDLSEKCFEYLKYNFWRLSQKPMVLRAISHKLMARLMAAGDLLLVGEELDLYKQFKRWIFVQSAPTVPEEKDCHAQMENFFSALSDDDKNDLSSKYADITCHFRIDHIVSSIKNLTYLRADRLVPHKLINRVLADQWLLLLHNNEERVPPHVSEEDFYKNAHRLGSVLDTYAVDGCKAKLLNAYATLFNYFENEVPAAFQSVVIGRVLPTREEFPLSIHIFYMTTAPPPKPFLEYWKPYLEKHGTSDE